MQTRVGGGGEHWEERGGTAAGTGTQSYWQQRCLHYVATALCAWLCCYVSADDLMLAKKEMLLVDGDWNWDKKSGSGFLPG